MPAVVTAWCSAGVSDVSALAWWGLVAEGSLFLAYGLVQGIGAPVVYGVIALVGSGLLLLRLSLGSVRGDVRMIDLAATATATATATSGSSSAASAGRVRGTIERPRKPSPVLPMPR